MSLLLEALLTRGVPAEKAAWIARTLRVLWELAGRVTVLRATRDRIAAALGLVRRSGNWHKRRDALLAIGAISVAQGARGQRAEIRLMDWVATALAQDVERDAARVSGDQEETLPETISPASVPTASVRRFPGPPSGEPGVIDDFSSGLRRPHPETSPASGSLDPERFARILERMAADVRREATPPATTTTTAAKRARNPSSNPSAKLQRATTEKPAQPAVAVAPTQPSWALIRRALAAEKRDLVEKGDHQYKSKGWHKVAIAGLLENADSLERYLTLADLHEIADDDHAAGKWDEERKRRGAAALLEQQRSEEGAVRRRRQQVFDLEARLDAATSAHVDRVALERAGPRGELDQEIYGAKLLTKRWIVLEEMLDGGLLGAPSSRETHPSTAPVSAEVLAGAGAS